MRETTPKIRGTHPAPCLDTLVNEVREGLPGDVAPRAFGDMKGAILQDNLPLADDHQRGATALHAFEDVVLKRLKGREHSKLQNLPSVLAKSHQSGSTHCPAITQKKPHAECRPPPSMFSGYHLTAKSFFKQRPVS